MWVYDKNRCNLRTMLAFHPLCLDHQFTAIDRDREHYRCIANGLDITQDLALVCNRPVRWIRSTCR